jgi:signal transduction histidine kinase
MIRVLASRKGLIIISGACLLVATASVLLLLHLSKTRRNSPYAESVPIERLDDWKAFGGAWETVDGEMRNNSDERGAKLMYGSYYWKNYSVEADIQLLGQYGDAGLILRAGGEEEGVDSYHGYFAGLRDLDNTIILGRADFGWREYQSKPVVPRINKQQWYHLKLLAYDCDLAASTTSAAGDTTTVAVRDPNCLQTGRFGLKSYATGALWRNVQIRPATRTDLVAMIGNATPRIGVPDPRPGGAALDEFDRYFEPINREVSSHRLDLNAQPISGLRVFSPGAPTPVTIHGVVTLTSPVLVLQDSTGGLAIPGAGTAIPLEIGDEVEVKGNAVLHDFSSTLDNADVHVLSSHAPVPPISVTASQAASGSFDALFIEIEGRLQSKEEGPDHRLILTLNDDSQSFRAIASQRDRKAFSRSLAVGSRLRLRGICVIDPAYTGDLTPFAVLVPSIDDIGIISGPPWWSTGHIIAAVITLLLLLLAVQTLQTRIERWRLQAVLDERERLAMEMHDTLAQSFAGIGFQLQAIRDEAGDGEAIHQQLDTACDLVRSSREEARRSIAALRPELLESEGLLKALDECARTMVDCGPIHTSATSFGDARFVPLRISDALFRIGREAITNAVRHGQPGEILISVFFEDNSLKLMIKDDGVGFPASAQSFGFGIQGMSKRADAIAADLRITSAPEQGTSVEVVAPLPPRRLHTLGFKYTQQLLSEHVLNGRFHSKTTY